MKSSILNVSNTRTVGLAAACITATCWSFLAIFIKIALNFSDAQTIVWYRMATAFLIMSIYLGFRKDLHRPFQVLLAKPGLLLIAALCLSANYLGYMKGIQITSPASAQVFIQMGPLLLALSGIIFFKEHLGRLQIIGLSFCGLGFGLFFYQKLAHVSGNTETFYLGLVWIFMAAVTWALFASLQKVLMKRWDSHQINLYIYGVATLVFLPSVDWSSLASMSWQAHCLFIFLGGNTLLAYGGLSLALKYLPATQVSPIITLNPLLTLFLIYLMEVFQVGWIPPDPITPSGYVGALLAVIGVIFIVAKKRAITNYKKNY